MCIDVVNESKFPTILEPKLGLFLFVELCVESCGVMGDQVFDAVWVEKPTSDHRLK